MPEPTIEVTAEVLLAAALMTIGAATAGCDRGELGRGARATSTSASAPRPDSTVATTRTIDNAGFVDNGGRTSDMTSRTEMSGMTATETGSERPTGTPGSGTPWPFQSSGARPNIGEGAGAASSERGTSVPSAGGPLSEAVGRLARARCDRETACNRIGPSRAWKSQESCVAHQRELVGGDVSALACPRGVDGVQLGTCLNALRGQACDDRRGDLQILPECLANALCAP
jgi:hypothetical protein